MSSNAGALRGVCARVALALAVMAAVSAAPSSAAAYHTDEDHITDDTAWTLQGEKDWRLGLFKASLTIADRVEVGTYLWPWVLRAPSAFAKVRFLSLGPLQMAAEGGFVRLDTSVFDAAGAAAPVFTVGTLGFVTSIEFGQAHQLSSKLLGTIGRGNGRVDLNLLLAGDGEAALTNLQYVLAYEIRASRSLAIVITGRYQVFQVLAGNTTFSSSLDDYTRVEVVAAASDDHELAIDNAFSIVPAVAWSWDTFNIRVGVGYGNFNIPGINFMVDRRTPIPELDLYWTF